MPFFYYPMSSTYMIGYLLVAIGSLIMVVAQIKVSSAYNKYEKIPNSRHMTGAMVAREILDRNGLRDVQINRVNGRLSDHYDPRNKTVNLSPGIHDGTSIASLAVASHECGHAIQHLVGYRPLVFRNAILPLCNVGQYLGWIAVFIGLLMGNSNIAWLGVILMSGILLFQIVTLPVEFDASSRALQILKTNYLTSDEYSGAKSMLSAAAFTYVAAMLSTVLSLLRIVLIVLGNDRD
ncbi:zinc metallopeptidase [Thomasclavelia saccharogumia]|uniref:zinc metallopeptidase n=1 Tax=Thomasclavelia saccharogumia TaxID=341225 RepID=UPI00047D0013|nr:zinc metallopeptidase [Thomasclavelia saccharogumia]